MTYVFKNVVNRRRVEHAKAILLQVQVMCQIVDHGELMTVDGLRERALAHRLLAANLLQAGVESDKAAQTLDRMADDVEGSVTSGEDGAA